MYRLLAVALCLAAALTAGCGGTQQIQTSAPRPATPPSDPAEEASGLPMLSVVLATGATALPADVQALRFRVSEVRIKERGGAWRTYPASTNRFELQHEGTQRKTVLSTRVPAAAYDSLALVLGDVFVQYDANAGAPLTLPRNEAVSVPIGLQVSGGGQARLEIILEPGASLSQDARCRWYFVPFLVPAASPPPEPGG